MIRLNDYINGNIDVEAGKSPICLTFDDGLENNILVTGTDKEGNINIDPNCAVGILESFKKKYPDFNVTATFFVNGGLFRQPEYNEQIIKWLVENGYDVGNHTYSHVDFTTTDGQIAQQEVGSVYAMLDEIIPGQYVNIVALPFGSPYSYDHEMIPYIQSGLYKVVEENGKLIWKCPQCGNTDQDKMNVARRTCGYIGTQFWNQGRTQEIRDRVLHL